MKWLAALFIMVVVSGCATAPVSKNETREIAADKWYDASYSKRHAPTDAEVLIKRDLAVDSSSVAIRFFVNDHLIAVMDNGEMARIYLKPGKYKIGIVPFQLQEWPSVEMDADISGSQPQTYRIYPNKSSGPTQRLFLIQKATP